ncbi:hypothetical protein HY640_00745 [Candidatus Woesearchaeota archaeon]|nr:hypothetical protein [Candidatus Woesearchaeota archaeon]
MVPAPVKVLAVVGYMAALLSSIPFTRSQQTYPVSYIRFAETEFFSARGVQTYDMDKSSLVGLLKGPYFKEGMVEVEALRSGTYIAEFFDIDSGSLQSRVSAGASARGVLRFEVPSRAGRIDVVYLHDSNYYTASLVFK